MQASRRWLSFCLALGATSAGCSASDGPTLDATHDGLPDREHESGGAPLAAATDSGARPVRITFRALLGDADFACDRSYARSGDGDGWLTPVDLRFFVRDVRAITADGQEQRLSLDVRAPWQAEDVALLDFEDGTGACAAGTPERNVEVTGTLPPADYVALSFENGVPEALNHVDPATLPPPLQPGGMHWGWLSGYRFLMAEIAGETGPGGSVTGSALLHLGSTACSGAPASGGITCNTQNRNRVRLDGFDLDEDEIVVDVLQLFAGIDLNAVTTCHSGGGEECAAFFERVGVGADGSPSSEQSLFEVQRAWGEP